MNQATIDVAAKTHAVPGLETDWDFYPSPVPRWRRREFVEVLLKKAQRRPRWNIIKPLSMQSYWAVYFIYAPDGKLKPSHRYTLARLREFGWSILVVCASRDAQSVSPELNGLCDAALWKALDGYDFSAYTLALRQISKRSPGADVFMMNDSVFGPFYDLRPDRLRATWDLTGYTASSQIAMHVQSYAFFLKSVTRTRMRKLASVFFPFCALTDASDVINLQELRLARVASRSMRVGAFWFGDADLVKDPTLFRPFELLDAGFPFLKKSLLTKHQDKVDDTGRVVEKLRELGHPVDDLL